MLGRAAGEPETALLSQPFISEVDSTLRIVPITLKPANNFVEKWHRHSARTNNDGGKFAIGLEHEGELVGVAIVGRPTSRMIQHGDQEFPGELLRLCTSPAAPKGSGSKLYARARRIWQLMGGSHFHTYTLEKESGASMRGAGVAAPVHKVAREQWDRANRPRAQREIYEEPKVRWSEELQPEPVK